MENNETLLDDGQILDETLHLVHATKGKRFLNYLIDYISIVIFMIVGFMVYDIFLSSSQYDQIHQESSWTETILAYLMFFLYYFFMEGFLKGKTIGKYLTRTRVVDYNGLQPPLKSIFIRTISRFVPFEGLSFFGDPGRGWHDSWSETLCIDEKESRYHL